MRLKRNPQPATFFENHFLMFVVWVDTKKAGLLLVNLPLLYMLVGCLFPDAKIFKDSIFPGPIYVFLLIVFKFWVSDPTTLKSQALAKPFNSLKDSSKFSSLFILKEELSSLITDLIGDGFVKNGAELEKLKAYVDDATVLKKLNEIKAVKKAQLCNYLSNLEFQSS